MADKKFMAGAATSNITPWLGVSINGGMSNRLATHVHDELHARCLVLDNGDMRMVMVVCDSCMIPGEVFYAAKHIAHGHTGIPMDWMLMSATHTHSAPASASVFQTEADLEYQEFLAVRIADAVRCAVNNLQPAQVAWGMGKEPTQVFNRRWKLKPGTMPANPWDETTDLVKMNPPRGSDSLLEPAGPTDPEVGLLAVQTADGKPLALLANYSLHYVGGTGPGAISADYFGVFADRIQQLLNADRQDPPFVGILSNGTSGNINNVDFQRPGTPNPPYAQMRRVAYILADEVLRVYGTLTFQKWVPLAMREAWLKLGVRVPNAAEVEQAKPTLSLGTGDNLSATRDIYARETVLLSQYDPEWETTVQALRIGDLGIASTPCETFTETGLAIKAASPLKPTFTIELANDYAGYLPTAEHHKLGGYETWRARSSFLTADSEAKVRTKILELLHEVAK